MNAQLLADAVGARRKELGMSVYDVYRAGGPAAPTMNRIESGEDVLYKGTTLITVDRALEWPRGSAFRILHEGHLPPAPQQPELLSPDDERALTVGRLVIALFDALQGDR